jgi:hypothetical protein
LLDGNNNLTYDYTANATYNNATTQINSTSLIGLSGGIVDICGSTALNLYSSAITMNGATTINGPITSAASTQNVWNGKNQYNGDVSFNSLVEFTNNARINTARKLYFKTNDTTDYITYDGNGFGLNTDSGISLRYNNSIKLLVLDTLTYIYNNLSIGSINYGANTGLHLFGSSATSAGIKEMTITQSDLNASVGYKNWQMGPNGNNYNFFTTDDTYSTTNNFLSFERKAGGAGVGKMIITSDYVGIGSASPSAKLDVVSTSNVLPVFQTNTNAENQISGVAFGIPAFTQAQRAKITSTTSTSNSSDLKFYTNAISGTTASERMCITSTGNVGIGTAIPSQKLEVNGGGKFTGLTSQSLYSPSDTDLRIATPNGRTLYLNNDKSGGNVNINTGSTNSHVIIDTGNLGVGVYASAKFHVDQDLAYSDMTSNPVVAQQIISDGTQRLYLGAYYTANIGQACAIQSTETYGGADYFSNLCLNQKGGNVGIGLGNIYPSYQLQISTDSAAKSGGGVWFSSSDERLKKNIEIADISMCYDIIKSIPLKRYTWRDDVYTTKQVRDRSKLGWIAQDVETVFPKAVNKNKFRYNQKFDSSNNLLSEDVIEDCRDLNADQLYAAMYGAIQSLIERNENKDVAIQELKNENASLKSRLTESENTLTQQVTINNNTLTAQVETLTSQVANLTSSVAAIKKLFNL